MNPGPSDTTPRRLEIDSETGDLRISFPYDPDLLPVVRSLPGRRWHPQSRHWSVPREHVREATEQLNGYGFEMSGAGASDPAGGEGAEDDLDRSASSPTSDGLEPRRGRGLVPGLPEHFASAREDETEPRSDAPKTLSVSHLNEWVRGKLLAAFPGAVWVTGEVIGYDRNAHKKHIYFQLADKVEGDDRPRAVVGAVLFERARRLIQRRLEQAPEPLTLSDGLKIRVRAKVDLYTVTGSYQIVVEEIDPSFTLGDIALRRDRILAEVDRRGLRERNLALPFPRPSFRIGLITSFESDAYNDLLNELQASGLPFDVLVRDVHVQGQFVERDVVAALAAFERESDRFDALVIVRGGGSRTDLMAFDSLPIALAVAEHPVKILVGIGHHRDQSALDFVAHSEKTPTAIGKRLVALAEAEVEFVRDCHRRLGERAELLLRAARDGVTSHARLFARTSQLRLSEARSRLASNAHDVRVRLADALFNEKRRLVERAERLSGHLVHDAERRRDQLARYVDWLPRLVEQRFRGERERHDGRAAQVRAADPARLLERGFTWLVDRDGHSIKSIDQVSPGDSVEARLADGRLRATVDEAEIDD